MSNRERRNVDVMRIINICQLEKSTIPRISATHESRFNSRAEETYIVSCFLQGFTRDERGSDAHKGATKKKETRIDGVIAATVATRGRKIRDLTGVESNKVKATGEAERELKPMVNGTLPTRGGRSKEGETREEVGNLDPRMNDPLYPGARVANLSRRAFTLICDCRASLPLPRPSPFQPPRRRLDRDPFLTSLFHPSPLPFPLPLR